MRKTLTKKFILIFFLLVIVVAAGIRIYRLDLVPPSPYWEEVALGYDAYSLLKTGADHHGTNFPIVAFESFGDWKPSLYFYAIIPALLVFDLSVTAVRIPAAISGTVLVLLIGYSSWLLAKEIWPRDSSKWYLSAIAGMITATFSPWLILFSRGGWEVMLGTTLLFAGTLLGFTVLTKTDVKKANSSLSSLQINSVALLFCVLFLTLSMYAYHGTRMLAPLFGMVLFFWWWLQIFNRYRSNTINWLQKILLEHRAKQGKIVLLSVVVASIVCLPLALSLGTPRVEQRFLETTIFSDSQPVIKSNQLRELHDYSLLSRIMYHRYWFFGEKIITQYFAHFSLSFLFVSGDLNPRHSVQYVGQLYLIELLPLLLGIGYIAFKAKKTRTLFFLLLGITVLPASISYAAPHALRTLPLAPFLLTAIGLGWVACFEIVFKQLDSFKSKKFIHLDLAIKTGTVLAFAVLYSLSVSQFFHYYWVIYPAKQSHEWQFGYKDVIDTIQKLQNEYPSQATLISREYGRPAMYYWFYTKTDPTSVQQASKQLPAEKKDQSELLEFDSVLFVDDSTQLYKSIVQNSGTYTIVGGSPEFITTSLEHLQANNMTYTVDHEQIIVDLAGKTKWKIIVLHI